MVIKAGGNAKLDFNISGKCIAAQKCADLIVFTPNHQVIRSQKSHGYAMVRQLGTATQISAVFR